MRKSIIFSCRGGRADGLRPPSKPTAHTRERARERASVAVARGRQHRLARAAARVKPSPHNRSRAFAGGGARRVMSTIYVHVGQAGNAVGEAFWTLAAKEKPTKHWLFDERGRAKAVLVDTEPKVVRGVVRALGPEKVHPRCALVEQSGRGNNWAMGYHGVDSSSSSSEAEAEAAAQSASPRSATALPKRRSRPCAGSGSGATGAAVWCYATRSAAALGPAWARS